WWMLAANIFWAIAYDTEYAMVDRDDDVKLKLRSSAITFGRFDVAAVMVCYAATLGLLAGIGASIGAGIAYHAGLVVAGGMMLVHGTWIRSRERMACFRAFNHNNWVGGVIFSGIVIDFFLRRA